MNIWEHNIKELCARCRREDFAESEELFEEIYKIPDIRDRSAAMMAADNAAQSYGITDFRERYDEFDYKKNGGKLTGFSGQDIELKSGQWKANDWGISRAGRKGEEFACRHPLTIAALVTNLTTGTERIELSFKRGQGPWRSLTVDRKTVASKTEILKLADYGVGVTSESARLLVEYIAELEQLNYEKIPKKRGVNRCGWYEGKFIPLGNDIIFDGEEGFRTIYNSIKTKGKDSAWKGAAGKIRQNSIAGRVALAASFASVLVEPLKALPFFVHIWGPSGTGKTVALKLAASVWGDPTEGGLWATFNGTEVGFERRAGFLNSLPMLLDELQIVAEKGNFDKILYTLAEGAGRSRGTRNSDVQKIPQWRNVILTTGEMPITNSHSGGGAMNRVLELECSGFLSDDFHGIVETVQENHGYAGPEFVYQLREKGGTEKALELFKNFANQLRQHDTTGKQTQAAALILTADSLVEEWIFGGDKPLTIEELLPFLKTAEEVDSNLRAYRTITGILVANRAKFDGNVQRSPGDKSEAWGVIPDGHNGMYIIISHRFDEICESVSVSPTAFLSWANKQNLLEVSTKGFRKNKRVNGESVPCVWLKVQQSSES